MLNLAARHGWIAKKSEIAKPRPNRSDFKFIETQEKIDRFLEAAKADPYIGAYEFYATAIYTGMRAGELCGLRWSDIDFAKRLITVGRSYAGPTKSGAIRYIPILDPLLPILLEWEKNNPLVPLNPEDKAYVFLNPHDHRPLPPDSGMLRAEEPKYKRYGVFGRVLRRAGIPRVRFHDLRHTFASHWVMRGGDLYKLRKILGHSTIAMTERYAHLAPDAFKDDYGRLGNAIAS